MSGNEAEPVSKDQEEGSSTMDQVQDSEVETKTEGGDTVSDQVTSEQSTSPTTEHEADVEDNANSDVAQADSKTHDNTDATANADTATTDSTAETDATSAAQSAQNDEDWGDFGDGDDTTHTAVEAVAPIKAPTATVETDDWGDFGESEPAAPTPVPQPQSESPPQRQTEAAAADDDWGDFGDDEPESQPAPKPTPQPIQTPEVVSQAQAGAPDDDWGDFDESEPAAVQPSATPAPVVAAPNVAADDDWGDFGESEPAAQPTPQLVPAPKQTATNDDDWGDFDDPPQPVATPAKPQTADDDWGDFGESQPSQPAATQAQPDDDWGDFGDGEPAATPAPAPVPLAVTKPPPIEDVHAQLANLIGVLLPSTAKVIQEQTSEEGDTSTSGDLVMKIVKGSRKYQAMNLHCFKGSETESRLLKMIVPVHTIDESQLPQVDPNSITELTKALEERYKSERDGEDEGDHFPEAVSMEPTRLNRLSLVYKSPDEFKKKRLQAKDFQKQELSETTRRSQRRSLEPSRRAGNSAGPKRHSAGVLQKGRIKRHSSDPTRQRRLSANEHFHSPGATSARIKSGVTRDGRRAPPPPPGGPSPRVKPSAKSATPTSPAAPASASPRSHTPPSRSTRTLSSPIERNKPQGIFQRMKGKLKRQGSRSNNSEEPIPNIITKPRKSFDATVERTSARSTALSPTKRLPRSKKRGSIFGSKRMLQQDAKGAQVLSSFTRFGGFGHGGSHRPQIG